MKYTKEISDSIVQQYTQGADVRTIADSLGVPDRSIIAKLSSLGVYTKKQYLNKRGEVPVKKYELIEQLATTLQVPSDQLESLEKVNKSVLILLNRRLGAESDPKPD